MLTKPFGQQSGIPDKSQSPAVGICFSGRRSTAYIDVRCLAITCAICVCHTWLRPISPFPWRALRLCVRLCLRSVSVLSAQEGATPSFLRQFFSWPGKCRTTVDLSFRSRDRADGRPWGRPHQIPGERIALIAVPDVISEGCASS